MEVFGGIGLIFLFIVLIFIKLFIKAMVYGDLDRWFNPPSQPSDPEKNADQAPDEHEKGPLP